MKPYITDSLRDGIYSLPYQIEGIERKDIVDLVQGAEVIAYAIPSKQSLQCAWLLRLFCSEGFMLEFSAASTSVGGWKEQGSLNINIVEDVNKTDSEVFSYIKINSFRIQNILSLVHDSENIFSESGIVFQDGDGTEIIILCGVSPGSVTMKTPNGLLSEIDSELDYKDYQRALV